MDEEFHTHHALLGQSWEQMMGKQMRKLKEVGKDEGKWLKKSFSGMYSFQK